MKQQQQQQLTTTTTKTLTPTPPKNNNTQLCMTRPQDYKTFLGSIQLSLKFQLLIKTKILKNMDFLA